MKIILIVFSFFIVVSCSNTKETGEQKRNERFKTFLNKFKLVDLPVKINPCDISLNGLSALETEVDTSFVHESVLAYYSFKTNGEYIAVITLELAESPPVILTTYTKDGRMIDQRKIANAQCGSFVPGFSCTEILTIKSDFSIYTSDTIASCKLDSLGDEIPSTIENYVIYKKGYLTNSGQIELTEEIKESIKM